MRCETLADIPLRAILSWEEQPSGPNFKPVWGNVIDTHVQPVEDDGTNGGRVCEPGWDLEAVWNNRASGARLNKQLWGID